MTTQPALPNGTDLHRPPAARDLRGRSQRELVAASLLLCANHRGAKGG